MFYAAEVRFLGHIFTPCFLSGICAALLLPAAVTPAAQAAERITLQNGFEMRCDHHGDVEGRTRLYMNAAEDNYIELRPEEIAAIEKFTLPTRETKSGVTPAPTPKFYPVDLPQMLNNAGHEHNLDVDLLASVVKAESGGNAHAVSRTGARGLMQLMPGTASQLGVKNSFEPHENVRGGSAYLDELLTRYHDNLALALAAYNAGPNAVDKYHGVPPYPETRAYVKRVIHEFNRRVLARQAAARRAGQTTASVAQ